MHYKQTGMSAPCARRRLIRTVAAVFSVGLSGIAGCGRPVLSADDAVVRRNGSILLRAYVERRLTRVIRTDVKNQVVQFYLNGELFGEAQTDKDGVAVLRRDLDDATASTYSAQTTMDGHALRSERPIYRLATTPRVGVVVDIDGTVCHTSKKGAVFASRDTRSKSFQDSAATIHNLTSAYDVCFLTGRPRMLLSKTRLWVKDHEFPDIPLFSAASVREALTPGKFKNETIARARKDFPDILIGIGDLESDRYAYRRNGMLALIVGHGRSVESDPAVISFPTWSALARFFEGNRDVLTDAERLRTVIEEGGSFRIPVASNEGT